MGKMDDFKNIDETIEYLKKTYSKLIPCSIKEIRGLETKFNLVLPEMYIKFLLTMGKGSSDFMVGDDYAYNWLLDLKFGANEILMGKNMPILAHNTFVFWMHQGYQFCYFNTDENKDNPPIYYFNECFKDRIAIKVSQNLSTFLYYYPESLENALNKSLFSDI